MVGVSDHTPENSQAEDLTSQEEWQEYLDSLSEEELAKLNSATDEELKRMLTEETFDENGNLVPVKKTDGQEQQYPYVATNEHAAESSNQLGQNTLSQENLGLDGDLQPEELAELKVEVDALFSLAADLLGNDRIVLRGAKLGALPLLSSADVATKVRGLQMIIFQDPTLDENPAVSEIPQILAKIREQFTCDLARKVAEDEITTLVNERLESKQEDYVKEIRLQILKEQDGVETPETLKKLAQLEQMNSITLAAKAGEKLRPGTLGEIVGQEDAVKALIAKIASPYPQHMILYGPAGVGKTSAARLALLAAKEIDGSVFSAEAKFVEVDGATLRWDPRDITNPLLGSVHDPIYQGAKKDLAETGIPEPRLGLVSEAHGGILFIDEIGEMDELLLNKLLKVLEDKKVVFESSYFDSADPNVPEYIRKLFLQGAPADFILIGATTRGPEEMPEALRSRCAEVYFNPLMPPDIQQIIINSAEKLNIQYEDGVPQLISDLTIEGRKANSLFTDALGLALFRKEQPTIIRCDDIKEMSRLSRLTPYKRVKNVVQSEIAHTFGLGVYGFLGSVLEIEAAVFPASDGKGTVRFNETAGSMAKDSVFNVTSVLRNILAEDINKLDIHINIIGGGNIDGPSAGLAFFLAVYSAITGRKIKQDTAVTGELSIQGKVKPVGGIAQKIYGAKQEGLKRVLVPVDNGDDVPGDLNGIEVVLIANVEEAIKVIIE